MPEIIVPYFSRFEKEKVQFELVDIMKMNILITGANGQLGNCLRDLAKNDTANNYIFTDVEELDITDAKAVSEMAKEHHVHVIINAAAYTAVDRAEEDIDKCYLINCDATANLAAAAVQEGALLVHVSTDYVFDGSSNSPYKITDPVNPKSIYGKSKVEGEKLIKQANADAVVIRTSWLYSEYGNNFVKTMLRLGKEKPELRVVNDQVGGPTYAGDLAKAIMGVVKHRMEYHGLTFYHFANQGVVSWNGFAAKIMEMAGLNCKVLPISTAEYGAKAPRPASSVFDLSVIQQELGIEIPQWEESLRKCIYILENK